MDSFANSFSQLSAEPMSPSTDFRPVIVGLYGMSCSGKSHLLNALKPTLNEEFLFFEGAEELVKSMALSISEALPTAGFLHAKVVEDVPAKHLQAMRVFVLIDSVINNGTTMKDFARRIQVLDPAVLIVMIAGVVQRNAVAKLETLKQELGGQELALVALRISEN
jgi:hypothetical protein